MRSKCLVISGACLALLGAVPEAALAVSLGSMAERAAADLQKIPTFISVAFYLAGILVVGFGLLTCKRHVDQPQQTRLGGGIMALVIGAALIAAPAVISGVAETFNADPNTTLQQPKLIP